MKETTIEKINRITNEYAKTEADKQTSDCCGANVLSVQGYPKDEGTHYWQCSKCGAPCNIMDRDGSQTKRKRDASTTDTALFFHHYKFKKI